jgi:ubiquinone/menaquinone biosynthesis C-methylase UbiE
VQFLSPVTARTYNDRAVDKSWNEWALHTLRPIDRDIVDIGCGGGIYSYSFAAIGARSVIGVDKSPQYIEEAIARLPQRSCVEFRVGSAEQTNLPDASADIVFERALIHHLSRQEMDANAAEANRLLRQDGMFVVQDRTVEDVESTDQAYWIRATLFEVFPRLVELERARRPSRKGYSAILAGAGFAHVQHLRYDEVRKTYDTFSQLRSEILSRKGKSILFELNDMALERYCARLQEKAVGLPLIERDPWSVWLASR